MSEIIVLTATSTSYQRDPLRDVLSVSSLTSSTSTHTRLNRQEMAAVALLLWPLNDERNGVGGKALSS